MGTFTNAQADFSSSIITFGTQDEFDSLPRTMLTIRYIDFSIFRARETAAEFALKESKGEYF